MRVLVAPDCFTGTLTAGQAAAAIAEGWARHAPHDEVACLPLSDGGPGFLEVLAEGLDGDLRSTPVRGPLGESVTAQMLLVRERDGRVSAYLETAQACGLHLVPTVRRDPGLTTTAGVGDLMAAARDAGASRIVLGLGGSGTNDAGAGALAALGERLTGADLSRFTAGGAALAGVRADELGWLAEVRRDWSGVELVVASDVDSPLLGLQGASAGFAAQKGASPERAQELERCLADFAAAVSASSTAAAQATAAKDKVEARPGSGAAGGLGYGLALLGATRVPGVQAVVDAVGLSARLREVDLVITGEGSFDWQSLRGKVVAGVARTATEVGTPVVVIAGQVLVGRREAQAAGVDAAYPVARTPEEVRAALADPQTTLAARAERVARTWSPRSMEEQG